MFLLRNRDKHLKYRNVKENYLMCYSFLKTRNILQNMILYHYARKKSVSMSQDVFST